MDLHLNRPYLSIRSFPDVSLPSLTIVMGLNGSGKSHMLQAVANGSMTNSIVAVDPMNPHPAPGAQSPVRLLANGQAANLAANAHSPMPGMPGQTGGMALSFEQARQTVLEEATARLDGMIGGIGKIARPGEDVWRLGADEVIRRVGDTINPAAVATIPGIFAEADRAISTGGRQPHMMRPEITGPLRSVPSISSRLGIPALAITAVQARQYSPWGSSDQFEPNIAMVFGTYRDTLVRNRLLRMQGEDTGAPAGLSDSEFEAEFGPPPWLLLSDTLHSFGLPYDAAAPDVYEFSHYTFALIKSSTGEPVSFVNLSSGEKVLLHFALSTFQYDEDLITVSRPKVLLLDEMDASLHPEMVHRWLSAINNGLVSEQGMSVILTTHSPTTVALAPETSLYEMRDGISGLTKITKQDALNRLTFGVPTLSIDFSGQRQVFAESDTDAGIYQRIYSLIKAEIDCTRELAFLSTGMRKKDGGEINSGCTIVRNIVQSLFDAGNKAVYGVVDWDGYAESTDRVKVLAEGSRDGIESVLLDPLLICLLLMKIRKAPENLKDIDRFVGADRLAPPDLQRMADEVQHTAFPDAGNDKIEVSYLGGATINVLREYATINDHDLEDALVKAFPSLNKWFNRGRGELVKGVLEEVLTEHRGFCPVDLKTLFESIANAPA